MIPTTWNNKTYKEFINYLDSIKDNKYKEFHNSLVKDSKYEILGVKLPILRNISKEISNIGAKYLRGSFDIFDELSFVKILFILSEIFDIFYFFLFSKYNFFY